MPTIDATQEALLWAMHLETFVPKPRKRHSETDLMEWLDGVLLRETIRKKQRTAEELQGLNESHRQLVEGADRWENLVFGYTAYSTEGTFMGLTNGFRKPQYCDRETTLVFKFIVTNYRSKVFGDARPASMTPNVIKPSELVNDTGQKSELLCMQFHYEDTCQSLIDGMAAKVLPEETEIWSQIWYSTLVRRKRSGERDPIILPGEKKQRLDPSERVVCVCDYVAD